MRMWPAPPTLVRTYVEIHHLLPAAMRAFSVLASAGAAAVRCRHEKVFEGLSAWWGGRGRFE